MKLSEMSTRQAEECMADMIDAVGRIVEDTEIKKAFEDAVLKKKAYEQKLSLMTKLPPLMLRRHMDDTAQIVAILMGKTPNEVLDQPFKQTIQDITSVMDKDLVDFFKSLGALEQDASSM